MNEASKFLGRPFTRADELMLVERLTLSAAYAAAWIEAWAAVTGVPHPESGSPLREKLLHEAVPTDGEEYRFLGLELPRLDKM